MIDALVAYLSGPGAGLLGSGRGDSLRVLKTSGAHAPGARVNFFVFSGAQPHPCVVCHTARHRCGEERLRAEWHLRQALQRALPESMRHTIPRVLALEEIAGALVLIEEAVWAEPLSGPPRSRFVSPRRNHIARDLAAVAAWLAEFQRATHATQQPWTDADDEEHVLEPFRKQARWLDGEDVTALEQALLRRVTALHGVTIAWAAHHGDFWYGNVLRRSGGLVVVDWEAARAVGPAFADPLTFAFQYLFWRQGNGRFASRAPILAVTQPFLQHTLGTLCENPAQMEAAFLVTVLARCASSYFGEGMSPWMRLLTATLREPRTMEWLRS